MRTPAQVGQQIANEIEELGHYQRHRSADGVCIVTASSFPMLWGVDARTERDEFIRALSEKAGFDTRPVPYAPLSTIPIFGWNDTTPTAEVLETLRSL